MRLPRGQPSTEVDEMEGKRVCSEGAGRGVEGRKGKRGQNLHLSDTVDHLSAQS